MGCGRHDEQSGRRTARRALDRRQGGGGTTLTPRATSLIAAFRTIEREHRRFIEAASAAVAGFDVDWALIGRIGMKTSARNQLFGKVASIVRGTVNDEVTLTLPGGQPIVPC